MSLTEIESYRELIQENIGYEYLCQQYETYREDLDEIVELIVETVFSTVSREPPPPWG